MIDLSATVLKPNMLAVALGDALYYGDWPPSLQRLLARWRFRGEL